jgi:DNA polymerase-3 subunit epsilon
MGDFITIDFETATNDRHSAISVGLVKFRDYQSVDTYYSLIRPPELYIRPDFTDIHGLTVDDVKDAPTFLDIWNSGILPFISNTKPAPKRKMPMAAHNAPFDMGVLKAVLQWYDLPIPKIQYFCTCILARRTWPEQKSHALTKLAKTFGVVYQAHNALDDALTCGKLVEMAAEKFGGKQDIKYLLKAAGVRLKWLM